jgi:hypothetical protein
MDWEKVQAVIAAGFCNEPDASDVDEHDEWWNTPNALARIAVQELRDGGFIVVDPAEIRPDSKLVLVEERPCDLNGRDGGVWCTHPFANCSGCVGNGYRRVKVRDL